MAHVIFFVYTTKDGHERLTRQINNWRYEVKGPHRTGYEAPFISEIKLYDVRISEKNVAQFLTDMQLEGTQDKPTGRKHFFEKAVFYILKIGRRLIGLKTIKRAENQKYRLRHDWHYPKLVGVMKDDYVKDDLTGIVKEML